MASKTSAKGSRPGGNSGKGRRPSGRPIAVKQPKPWGWIAASVVLALVVVGVLGYIVKYTIDNTKPWQERAAAISGIVNFGKTDPALVKGGNHPDGKVNYKQSPPVAGPHNGTIQNCMGDVYAQPIANEHVVHSLEHGAVWITYKPGLAADQVKILSEKVKGQTYMLMSPYDKLDKNISLQAWGYQLKVDDAGDERIDTFIKALRTKAGPEPGAPCSGGVSTTGTEPLSGQPGADAPVQN